MIFSIFLMLFGTIVFMVGVWHLDLLFGSVLSQSGLGNIIFTNGWFFFDGWQTAHIALYLILFGVAVLLFSNFLLLRKVFIYKNRGIKNE